MLKHLIFLIYILSTASGIIAFVYFFLLYKRSKSFLLKKYLYFFSSFSFLMFSASISVYLGVNTSSDIFAVHLFTFFILIGITFLLYTLPVFMHAAFNYPVTFFLKIIIPIFSFFSLSSSICFWFMKIPKVTIYFVITPLVLYSISFLYSMLIVFKNKKVFLQIQNNYNITLITYTILSISFAIFESVFMSKTNFKYDYPISLPIIYLSWNIISMIFNIGGITKAQNESGIFISEDLAIHYKLTPQETKISNYILQGMSNKEIAYYLKISTHTVKNHIYNLFNKTNVQSRIELIHTLYKKN